MNQKVYFFIFLFVCSSIFASGQQKLVFATHWLPQAQFAGYYMALKKGFYSEAGLDVQIINPPANVNAVEYLETGKADVASLFLITAIESRLNGLNIVNIAQMSEHSAIMFVSKKSSKITTIKDFNDKKLGVWKSGFEEVPRALVANHNLNVEWIPIMSSVNLFLVGGIDLMTVMWYNEYHQIYLSGLNKNEMDAFFLSDYDFDIPEDGLYVVEENLNDRSEELKAFVQASIRGWQYAAQHREETLEEVLNRMYKAKIQANKAHQTWMLDKILQLQSFDAHIAKDPVLEQQDFKAAMDVLKHSPHKAKIRPMLWEEFCKPVLLEPVKPLRYDQ